MSSRSFGFVGLGLLAAVCAGCESPQQNNNVPVQEGPLHPRETPPPINPPSSGTTVQVGDTDQAREIYNAAVALLERKEYAAALHEFRRATNVDSQFFKAYFKMGYCYYQLQKYDLEIEYYNRCLEINPQYLECLVNLGNALLARDELERAIKIYHRVLEIEVKNPVALFNLGLIYYDLQQYANSQKCLERYIEANPTGPDRQKAERYLERARGQLQR